MVATAPDYRMGYANSSSSITRVIVGHPPQAETRGSVDTQHSLIQMLFERIALHPIDITRTTETQAHF